MYKYHSIEQFRNAIKEVSFLYKDSLLPILSFNGTVKIHGTNAGVELPINVPQSRNQILTEGNDSYGFYSFHKERKDIFQKIYDLLDVNFPIVIYGEWAGKGIQQNVGVSKLDRAFYIFGIKVITGEDAHYWLKDYVLPDLSNSCIFDIRMFGVFKINIDFNNPQLVQNELIELTNKVEIECPVAKYFGVIGVGEGIVWEHITENGDIISFKVKGEKHSSSKVKVLSAIDTESIENIAKFIEYSVTENRMQQAWTEIFDSTNTEPDIKNLGSFIKWVSNDIQKEESDTLINNNLTMKDIGSNLSKKSKHWFLNKLNGLDNKQNNSKRE